jgi:hypothetical protein
MNGLPGYWFKLTGSVHDAGHAAANFVLLVYHACWVVHSGERLPLQCLVVRCFTPALWFGLPRLFAKDLDRRNHSRL